MVKKISPGGEIGRHKDLKSLEGTSCRFKSGSGHQINGKGNRFKSCCCKNKRKILYFCLLPIGLSVLFFTSTFFLTTKYTSSATLMITNMESSNSLVPDQYRGLASLAGVNLGGSGDGKMNFVTETLNSYSFFNRIFENEDLKIFLLYEDGMQENSINYHEDYFKKDLSWSIDSKTSFLKISYSHPSPDFAFRMVNILVEEINSLAREKDLEKSSKALEYLKDKSRVESNKSILQSIGNLIESQLQTQMLADINKDYLIEFIDPPYIPIKNPIQAEH